MSRRIDVPPRTVPSESSTGKAVSDTYIDVPSLRTLLASRLLNRFPASTAAKISSVRPASLGVTSFEMCMPVASATV